MSKNCLLRCGLAIFAVVGAASPGWGQRIRFAQAPPDEVTAAEDESQVAAQPLTAKSSPSNDPRPAAPTVEAEVEDVPAPSAAPLARRIPVGPMGEVIETPPPFFIEPETSYPLYDYPPYGDPMFPPYMPPGQPRLWKPGLWKPGLWKPGVVTDGCRRASCYLRGAGVFGEFLYLRPRDTEVAFAVPGQAPVVMAGNPAVAVPQGGALLLDPDYAPGYRVGAMLPLQECIEIRAAYTMFESDVENSRVLSADEIQQNIALFPLLLHPRTLLPNNVTNVAATGELDVNFETIDLDTRVLLWDSPIFRLTGYGGARWADLEQDLLVNYSINNGTVVQIASSFEGLGPRLGVDGFGALGCWGFGYYARSEVSFLFGASKGSYEQFQVNNRANPQVFTDWKADRLAPVYELELGFQWMSPKQRVRLSAGYLMNVWFNVITTEEVVQGLQQNEFDDLSDTLTFDGLTARVELRL